MRLTVCSIFIFLALCSCKKHVYNETRYYNRLIGSWNFISIDAQTQSSQDFKLGELNQRSEAQLNYITENNSGTIIFGDSVITALNLTYTISSEIKTYNYKNGILADSSTVPYDITFFEPQSYCKYKLISNDSISFPKGGFTNIAASTLRTDPLAAELIWDEYTLKLREHIYKDTTIIKLGTAYRTIQTGTAIMTLQRK